LLTRPARQSARQRRALRARSPLGRVRGGRWRCRVLRHATPAVAKLSLQPYEHTFSARAYPVGDRSTMGCMPRAGFSHARYPVVHLHSIHLSSGTQAQGRAALMQEPRCTRESRTRAPAGTPRRADLRRAARRSAGCAASARAAASRAAGDSNVRYRLARPAGCRKSSRPTSASWYVRGIIASACAAARGPRPPARLLAQPISKLACARPPWLPAERGSGDGAEGRRPIGQVRCPEPPAPHAAPLPAPRASPRRSARHAASDRASQGAPSRPAHAQRGVPRAPPGRARARAWFSWKTCVSWLDATLKGSRP
jgi:hypothetical protein